MAGIYIHVPFCRSRCVYCDFYSTTLGLDVAQTYVRAVAREMSLRRDYIKDAQIETVYLGGGTPSLLPANSLKELFDAIGRHFSLDEEPEVTIEANPDDVCEQWLQSLKDLPVNRISMGGQTFNDKLLASLGRRHDANQTVEAVEACRKAGFGNISLDLIYGLPGQTMDDWQRDVEKALSLGIKHLSAYALSYEKGTRLDAMLKKGLVEEADEELSRKMYDHLMSATAEAGFQHYEISNFALPSYHSRHNSSYWQGVPYLGLGAGAHSYDGRRCRRANLPDIKAYIAATGDVPHETEELSDEELYNEFILTRLRTSSGIPLLRLSSADRQYCLSMASPHLEHQLLCMKDHHLCLTKEGIFTSNDIISDLMKSEME